MNNTKVFNNNTYKTIDSKQLNLTKFNDFKFIANKFPLTNFIDNTNTYNITSLIDNAHYYVLKPKGRKAYLWFTYYKKDLLCLLIFINNKNLHDKSNEFYNFDIKYDNTLCYNNVLLNGTYFYKYNTTNLNLDKSNNSLYKNKINNIHHYFVLDNVLNYNIFNNVLQKKYCNELFKFKLNLYKNILNFVCNINTICHIYLGIILDSYDDIFKIVYKLNYQIYCISCYNSKKYLGNFIINNTLLNKNNLLNNFNNNLGINFKITACLNQDLYNLYILENNKEIFYDYALIDSYKTSIFMNKLFRKIKENNNLDLLEESDEEEEFENIDLDKYVNLEKSYIIECVYNKKFKKWIPKNLAKNSYIVEKNKINFLINKNKIFL